MTTYAALTALERKRSLSAYIASPRPSTPAVSTGDAFQGVLSSARAALAENTKIKVVRPGDTLSSLCESQLRLIGQDTSPEAVAAAVQRVAKSNRLSDANQLSAGQTLNLGAAQAVDNPRARLPEVGFRPREVVAVNSAAAAKTDSETVGRADGLAALREELRKRTQAAPDKGDSLNKLATSLLEVINKNSTKEERVARLASQVLDKSARVTSDFGLRADPFTGRQEQHNGIDLAVDSGTKVYAAQPGTVVFSGWQSGYGQTVVVRHANGTETLYAHNSMLLAKEGDVIDGRTAIAQSGSSGRATGPHLHFEVRENGLAVDPATNAISSPLFQVAKAS